MQHEDDTLSSLVIRQTAPEDHPTLRPHMAQIAFYELNEYIVPVITRVISEWLTSMCRKWLDVIGFLC